MQNTSIFSFQRFWNKLPVFLQAIVAGFIVNTIGVGTWVLVASFVPAPWCIAAMAVLLVLYWWYFAGNGWPRSTQEKRQLWSRETNLKKHIWVWGLVTAFILFVFVNSGLILTFRVVEFNPSVFKTARYLESIPQWLAWAFLIMASLVAGICEEVGFRGYMQKPLEQKYGPLIGISITSLIFVVVHLHQAWAGGILLHIFVISLMVGYLTYATNSLIPGIIAHTTFDIVNFSYWWSDVAGTFSMKPIGITGVDGHFILIGVIVLVTAVAFIFSIRKLLVLESKELDFVNT